MQSLYPLALELTNVSSRYGAITALNQVSLQVREKEIVTLIGANGAGKSTLLMTIFGEPKAFEGNIYVYGKDITFLDTHHILPLGISLAPEGRRIFPNMTVEENLLIGADMRGSTSADEERIKIFNFFPVLRSRRNQSAGTLSGGEQQMLAIGRALMSAPKLLLLDEPSLGLAPMIVKQIFEILRDISKLGTTIFLVEQNAFHSLRLADRGYVLVNGSIRMTGTGEELLNNPEVKNAYLGSH